MRRRVIGRGKRCRKEKEDAAASGQHWRAPVTTSQSVFKLHFERVSPRLRPPHCRHQRDLGAALAATVAIERHDTASDLFATLSVQRNPVARSGNGLDPPTARIPNLQGSYEKKNNPKTRASALHQRDGFPRHRRSQLRGRSRRQCVF